jgi:hypothetical protein
MTQMGRGDDLATMLGTCATTLANDVLGKRPHMPRFALLEVPVVDLLHGRRQ